LARSISFSTSIEKGESVIGGGTLPDVTLESPILLINNEKTVDTVNQLIKNDIPIIPRIIKDQVCLDLRSVFQNQDDIIVQALNNS
jgi:Selenocysteine synthase [seryl-tRNASer selenium transferase]